MCEVARATASATATTTATSQAASAGSLTKLLLSMSGMAQDPWHEHTMYGVIGLAELNDGTLVGFDLITGEIVPLPASATPPPEDIYRAGMTYDELSRLLRWGKGSGKARDLIMSASASLRARAHSGGHGKAPYEGKAKGAHQGQVSMFCKGEGKSIAEGEGDEGEHGKSKGKGKSKGVELRRMPNPQLWMTRSDATAMGWMPQPPGASTAMEDVTAAEDATAAEAMEDEDWGPAPDWPAQSWLAQHGGFPLVGHSSDIDQLFRCVLWSEDDEGKGKSKGKGKTKDEGKTKTKGTKDDKGKGKTKGEGKTKEQGEGSNDDLASRAMPLPWDRGLQSSPY